MDQMASLQSTALVEPGYFPPISAHDWSQMQYGESVAINPNAARMVYDVCWFILKDGDAALETTTITFRICLLYTSPSPRDKRQSRMPSSA